MQNFIATAAFGLEAIVKDELIDLGFADAKCLDNRVEFSSENPTTAIAKTNIWLRCADRVLLVLGRFEATTYDSLFERTKALPWGDWISKTGKFTVTGKSVKSGLYSVPDVQSIVKKAIVEKLKQKYMLDWFTETGAEYTIQVSLLKDIATLTIDTTGQKMGLHKRGYRARSSNAPIKETMAAALIKIAKYQNKKGVFKPFLDPCCGSGTFAIEAALMAKNIAPGIARKFAAESWGSLDSKIWKNEKTAAFAAINQSAEPVIHGSDINPDAVELAKQNAELAGVDDCVSFFTCPVNKIKLPASEGIAIINPPYGERIGSIKEAEELYAQLGRLFNPTKWNVYVITPDEFFETAYKKRARAKRKLFNGTIKTDYYQFF